jgi:hypothetical protein
MVILGCSGGYITATRGIPSRTSAEINKLAAVLGEDPMALNREGVCFLSSANGDVLAFNREVCLRRDTQRPNYLLFGDSHAAHYWSALHEEAKDWNVLQATASKCKPVLHPDGAPYCVELMNFILNEFIPKEKLDGVIVAARWRDAHLPALLETVDYLKKFVGTIIIIGPGVEYRKPLPRLLIDQVRGGDREVVAKARHSEQMKFDRLFAEALAGKNVHYVSPYKTLCGASDCLVVNDDGTPLQHDYGHLSREGALFLVRKWRSAEEYW